MNRLVKIVSIVFAVLVGMTTSTSAQVNPFGGTRGGGLEFTEADRLALQAAAEKLYTQDAPTVGSVEQWENPGTGAFGSVLLTHVFERDGMPCRRLQHDFKLPKNPAARRIVVTRCRVADGSWKLL